MTAVKKLSRIVSQRGENVRHILICTYTGFLHLTNENLMVNSRITTDAKRSFLLLLLLVGVTHTSHRRLIRASLYLWICSEITIMLACIIFYLMKFLSSELYKIY